ncbi:hypothetical protein [Acinetobacter baumannii]|uniref:hypothetical protein n=1 Tax=Acinetobacter baumannii TaxID=470 RepID=UPI001CDD6E66|nr:hypothetical protein [Acinetobacter baumannii]EHU1446248.1 hypothetical protein [Acinetobacter baumannii]EHU2667445.1 hypothetical protein [Acinetobacter baumannii]EHU3276437.1 hypothetical protein [Acinetobacter baumannii]MCA4414241.1 hypothetical protein [Acinetobacter baumannii]
MSNVNKKRAQFAKDIDKLVSDEYVLVPKKPTQEMIVSGLAVIATGIGKEHIITEVIKCWEKMLEAAQEASV